MLFEVLMTIVVLTIGGTLIGIPLYKLVRVVVPPKTNPLAEAKERLEQARLEAEAARLNKETESLYNKMYEEVLIDDEIQDRRKL